MMLAFSPDGKLLAGARYSGGATTVWDVARRRYHPTAAEPTNFYGTTFSADGQALILPSRGRPFVDWRTGKVIRRLADVEPDGPVNTYLSPDGKLYAVPDGRGPIRLLDAETGREVRTLNGHANLANSMAFSRDSRRLASCGFDKAIRVWDVASGQEIARFTPPEVFGSDRLSLSDDGRVLAVSFNQGVGSQNVLYTWDVEAKAQLTRIEAPNWFFSAAVLSPDGRFLAGGGGQVGDRQGGESAVTVWDAASGQVIHSLPGHHFSAMPLGAWCTFSPDGRFLATGDPAGRLRLWEVLSGQEVYRFEGHRTTVMANFSPDGRLLVAASNDAPCFVWDVVGTTVNPQPAAAVDRDQLWRDLADADAKKAFQAMRQLVARPGPAVELIRKNLKPAAGIERLRQSRALGTLELIATPEALRLIAELAAGPEGDRLTVEAAAARERLRLRGARP
jgi:WD40 repeat protein